MARFTAPCPACALGEHEGHEPVHPPLPDDVLGGCECPCRGTCGADGLVLDALGLPPPGWHPSQRS